jgi:hypothetical protein
VVVNQGRLPFPVAPFVAITLIVASHKIVVPILDSVPWYEPFAPRSKSVEPHIHALLSVGFGGLVGILLGGLTSLKAAGRNETFLGRHWILQCFLVGAVLGWQAVSTIVLGSLAVAWMIRWVPGIGIDNDKAQSDRWAFAWSACLIAVGLVHHSLWRQIAHLFGIG